MAPNCIFCLWSNTLFMMRKNIFASIRIYRYKFDCNIKELSTSKKNDAVWCKGKKINYFLYDYQYIQLGKELCWVDRISILFCLREIIWASSSLNSYSIVPYFWSDKKVDKQKQNQSRAHNVDCAEIDDNW